MGRDIGVLVAQRLDVQKNFKDVPIFLEDVPKFLKDVPRIPMFVSGWGTTSNHFPRVPG